MDLRDLVLCAIMPKMDTLESLRMELEAEKAVHRSDNKMFLDLLKLIWDDMNVFTPPHPSVIGELEYYADSWGWK